MASTRTKPTKTPRWNDKIPSKDELYNVKKLEIVRRASELFSRSGYHATTLADVAVSLGVTKQALYYYFSDKKDLLFACALAAHEDALAILKEEEARGNDAKSTLSNCLRRYAVHVADGNLQSIMFLDAGALDAKQVARVMELRDTFDAGIRAVIAKGVAQGSLRDADPKMMSFAALGAVNWISRWYRVGGGLSIADAANAIVYLVLEGLAV
jgi:TetR/AcrR family transcriptional regulator